MSERQLKGLKEHAQATILREIRVTPEMRARLEQHIRREERGRGDRRRPILSAALVACAFVLVVGPLAWQRYAPPPAAEAPAGAEIPSFPERGGGAGYGNVIPLGTNSWPLKVTVTDKSANLSVTDAAGNITVTNQSGAAVPPATSIAGVEAKPGQKIVLNGEYTLEVSDASQALQTLQALAVGSGGYVVEAALNQGQDGSWAGRVVLRIPSEGFGEAAARVAEIGAVKHRRQWTQDVTDQYADLEHRLVVLKEHEQKLQELALQAASFDEWLRLVKEINEVRLQLENLQGSLQQLANKVEYSTFDIALIQPAPGTLAVQQGDGLWQQMTAAFGGSLSYLSSLGRSFLISLAGALPVLVPVAALGGWLLLRLRRRRLREQP